MTMLGTCMLGRDSLSGNSVDETGSWTSEQKKQWWDNRKELDGKLGNTIDHFQVRPP